MKTNITAPDYKGYRFSPEIISHTVWLYFRFSLSFRDVEELLAQRGIVSDRTKKATYSKAITDLKAHGILPAPIELMQCADAPRLAS